MKNSYKFIYRLIIGKIQKNEVNGGKVVQVFGAVHAEMKCKCIYNSKDIQNRLVACRTLEIWKLEQHKSLMEINDYVISIIN